MKEELRFAVVDEFVKNPLNPRKELGDLSGLLESIVVQGVIEPLIVRPYQGNGKLELVAGERRLMAIQRGIKNGVLPEDFQIPYIKRDLSDETTNQIMIIENLQRKDLSDFERAQAFCAYINDENEDKDVKSLADATGFTHQYIRRQVRVMGLPDDVLKYWKTGALSFAHMEQLLRVEPEDQIKYAERAINYGWAASSLKANIDSRRVELSNAQFDKKAAGCNSCQYSTKVQQSLFGGMDMKTDHISCLKASCFFAHQRQAIEDGFATSKIKADNQTNQCVFSEEPYKVPRVYARGLEKCVLCQHFATICDMEGRVSVLQACVSPEPACYEETFKVTMTGMHVDDAMKQAEQKKKRKIENLGSEFAERFFAEKLPPVLADLEDDSPVILQMALMAIIAQIPSNLIFQFFNLDPNEFGSYERRTEYLAGIKDMTKGELRWALRDLCTLILMNKTATQQARRHDIARICDVLLERDFVMDEDYLKRISKETMIAMNQDWKIVDLSPDTMRGMKKTELIAKFLEHDLSGKIPPEIMAIAQGKETPAQVIDDEEE